MKLGDLRELGYQPGFGIAGEASWNAPDANNIVNTMPVGVATLVEGPAPGASAYAHAFTPGTSVRSPNDAAIPAPSPAPVIIQSNDNIVFLAIAVAAVVVALKVLK